MSLAIHASSIQAVGDISADDFALFCGRALVVIIDGPLAFIVDFSVL